MQDIRVRVGASESKAPYAAQKSYFVYILASLSGTLYIDVTNDLQRRALQHKQHEIDGFTKEYEVDRLVYYETFFIVSNAIARESNSRDGAGQRRSPSLRA